MKKHFTIILVVLFVTIVSGLQWLISSDSKTERERRNMVDTRVDNNGYYKRLAAKGYYTLNPDMKPAAAVFTGSKIKASSVRTDDSPDIPVTNVNSTQSENSIFVNPLDPTNVLNSNNSTQNPVGSLYGANDFYSFDSGETWQGKVQGAAGNNSGDPAVAMGWNGRWYINYITNPGGQGIAYSDNQGQTWTAKTVAPNPGDLADKNHLTIDNSLTSPYEGYLYNVWTDFGGANDSEIVVSRSTDDGDTWSTRVPISTAVNAGSHNQGVNVQTGPNGEVYAVWAIYNSWPSDEGALGFAKSMDGGATWTPATRILQNIRGIRTTETKKNHRVNSFPSMAVDISNSPDRGTIYVVWSNIGTPGVNTNVGIDVYLIKSTDQGATWSAPFRVNQNTFGQGKEHYFPWITCDPENGILSTIFYGDRNVSQTQVEVFCANSFDAGETWEDFKVSDVAFTPSPIPGLAGGYMGDYLGIAARGGMVYPVWPDNRLGYMMTFCSPYETNPLSRPFNVTAEVTFETGNVNLGWNYNEAADFTGFKVYRGDELIGTTTDTTFVDALPAYGVYTYAVTATYTGEGESSASRATVQWGDAHIAVAPESLYQILMPETTATQQLVVTNTGQLPMEYSVSSEIIDTNKEPNTYCDASGGGDEYISKVEVGTISNSSGETGYADYTAMSTEVKAGEPVLLTVTNGNPYSADQLGVWVDWDQNGEFDDAAVTVSGSPGNGPYTASIDPPVGAKSGVTRMRIRLTWTGSVEPCGTTTYGEVEDYTLNVVSWLSYAPSIGTIAPGATETITVTFKAFDLEEGDYYANLKIANNSPDNNLVIVPVHLKVATFAITAMVDPSAICVGGSATLTSTVTGGTGDLTFFWKNEAGDVVSNEQSFTASPLVTTAYTAFVVQGTDTIQSLPVTLTVYDLPVVALGDDVAYCGNQLHLLDAGNAGSTYLWSNGASTQTVEVSADALGFGQHQLWVQVTNINGCVSADTILVTYNALPVVELGEDQSACGETAITLNAGNEGANFLWSNGTSSGSFNATSAEFGYGSHQLWVQVTDVNGCVASDTVHAAFLEAPPVITIGNDTALCGGLQKVLAVNVTGYSLLWSNGSVETSVVADTAGFGFGVQTFYVDLTAENGCVMRSHEISVDFKDCTGIDERDATAVAVYPNPGNGLFRVTLAAGINEKATIRVYDAAGNMVFQQKDVRFYNGNKNEINLTGQPSGVYNMVIEGTKVYSKRLIIK